MLLNEIDVRNRVIACKEDCTSSKLSRGRPRRAHLRPDLLPAEGAEEGRARRLRPGERAEQRRGVAGAEGLRAQSHRARGHRAEHAALQPLDLAQELRRIV